MSRSQTWLALIVLAIGGLLAAIVGLFAYMSLTATSLHRDPQSVPSVTRSDPSRAWAAAVERGRHVMRGGLVDQNLAGLSVAVGAGGDIVWAEGFGWADLEKRVKVAPETRFKIGMASKVLTSAGAGLLLEKGRLELDARIQKYVPEFPEKQWPVTLRQVMGHVAGVGTDGGDEGPRSEHCDRTADGLRLFAGQSLLFEPGTRYRYSNYGWVLVSAAIETSAAEPFFAFMRTQIFEPLGMHATSEDSASEPNPDRATFYFPRFAGDPRYGLQAPFEPDVDYSCFAGSGAFVSTPSDLVRFGLAVERGTLLQPATVQLLQTPQRLISGEETGYGLGWDLETVDLAAGQTRVAGHDGDWMGATVVSFLTVPTHGIVVAVTSNTAFADTYALGVKVAQAFAEQGKAPAGK